MSAFDDWWDAVYSGTFDFGVSDVAMQAWNAAIKHVESKETIPNNARQKCLCDMCSNTDCCAEYSLGIRAIKCKDYMQS